MRDRDRGRVAGATARLPLQYLRTNVWWVRYGTFARRRLGERPACPEPARSSGGREVAVLLWHENGKNGKTTPSRGLEWACEHTMNRSHSPTCARHATHAMLDQTDHSTPMSSHLELHAHRAAHTHARASPASDQKFSFFHSTVMRSSPGLVSSQLCTTVRAVLLLIVILVGLITVGDA